jgi:alcohol dehydrogenase (NADP+)
MQNPQSSNSTSTYKAKAYSAASETSPLASTSIPRLDVTENDEQIVILF